MIDMTQSFEILFDRQILQVRPVKAGDTYVFAIKFKDGSRLPISITRAIGMNKPKFWTSIPEGRQPEAEAIGPLITNHYQQMQAADRNTAITQ